MNSVPTPLCSPLHLPTLASTGAIINTTTTFLPFQSVSSHVFPNTSNISRIHFLVSGTYSTRPYAPLDHVNRLVTYAPSSVQIIERLLRESIDTPCQTCSLTRIQILMAQSWNGLHWKENFHLLEGTSVQVYVGPEAQCWVLHTELVCHLSSYFKAALVGGFKEAEEKRVKLEEDDPNVFRIFVAWLYTGEIKDSLTLDFCLAWILGDKLGAPAFQDCTMLILVNTSGHLLYRPEIVEHIYSNTTEGSRLRALAVDSVVHYYREIENYKTEWMDVFSRGGDFVVDVMKAFLVWEDIENPTVVRAKYLLNARAILALDGNSRAGRLGEESRACASDQRLQELGGNRAFVDDSEL